MGNIWNHYQKLKRPSRSFFVSPTFSFVFLLNHQSTNRYAKSGWNNTEDQFLFIFEMGTPDGTNYCRLKMTDKDGTFTLSRIVTIQNDQKSGFIIHQREKSFI